MLGSIDLEINDWFKISVLFLPSSCLRRTQHVVGDVYSITREIKTADHDNPFARYTELFAS